MTGATAQVQYLTYQWDKVGNLAQRRDQNLNLTEDFVYDSLYRLDSSQLNGVTNLDMDYNELGNIKTKSDVGTYDYPASGTNSVRPHAVTSAGSNTYGYDANGNMNVRNGSAITWYSYNLNRIDKGSNYSQFFYGAGRSRYKQIAVTAAGGSLPAGTETTIYVGGLFEKVTKPSGVIEYKHSIMAGREAVAIRTLRSNSADDTRYLHKDHLGSVDAITNESGTVLLRLSYDAFGKRRAATSWSGSPSSADWISIASITHRGFTFREQLDNLDLIHMNGRVYDPNLGRFISADPFIQAPLMSQSLNRYSYVMNNPLSMTDPSGYSWLSSAFRSIGRFVNTYWRQIVAVVAAAVVTYFTFGTGTTSFWGAVAQGATAGAVAGATATALYGGSVGDIFRGAFLGGIAGAIGGGINTLFDPAAAGAFGGAAAVGTPGGSPPMTAPAGAISLTAGSVSEFFNDIRRWMFGTSPSIYFIDPAQRNEKTPSGSTAYEAVDAAIGAAYGVLSDKNGNLPGTVRGVLVRVTEGGSAWDRGTSLYHEPYENWSTITIHVADVLSVDQSTLNSIMLHELMHTVQDSKGGPYRAQPARERIRRELEAYDLQWGYRDDRRFMPNSGVLR
jgi:RHS repeat-associated protein